MIRYVENGKTVLDRERDVIFIKGCGNADDLLYHDWMTGGNAPEIETSHEKETANAPILAQIAQLESGQHRAVRESALGVAGAGARLAELDARIAALRARLV